MSTPNSQQIPINVAGSSTFGRYKKISDEKTYNMYLSGGWLVNYAGFKNQLQVQPGGVGRGLFNSIRGIFMLIVISSSVYKISADLTTTYVASIDSTEGDVYIDENLSRQICLVDGQDAYIYNYETASFTKQNLSFAGSLIYPSYVCYHNTFFLISSSLNSVNPQNWYAYEIDTPSTIKINTQLALQTKPDVALAVHRLPGRGNNVLVMGSTVCEVWTQVGGLENYRRTQSFNIDNGLVAVSTLAASDEYICWLAQNENNAPFIMLTDGANSKRLSTDGIDFELSQIFYPKQSCAFFYRQDGHLFYQLTFYHPEDNLSLIYDFTEDKFCHVADQNLNYHPARQIVFFDERTFFVSLNTAALYEMSTRYVTYDYSTDYDSVGEEIPRIRICQTVRLPDTSRFRVSEFNFWMEQGVISANPPTRSRVDLSFSKNGNQSFSNVVSKELNTVGHYKNQIRWFRLGGNCNEFTLQLRFFGFQRIIANNGMLTIY